jgi:hypothetical protein
LDLHELFPIRAATSAGIVAENNHVVFSVWRRWDVYDIFVETHVQHFVSFVKDTKADLRDVY